MMTPLQAFLIEDAGSKKEFDFVVSDRLKEYAFKVRALTFDEYNEIRKKSMDFSNQDARRPDEAELTYNLVVEGCVEPDFKSAEFLSSCGCATPRQAIERTLLAGEVTNLSGEILRVSGFGNNLDKLKKDAKN